MTIFVFLATATRTGLVPSDFFHLNRIFGSHKIYSLNEKENSKYKYYMRKNSILSRFFLFDYFYTFIISLHKETNKT